MFFDDEDEALFNPEVLHVVHRELYALNSNLDVSQFGLISFPTHTEDGIPIRKLYVSNLPPKTTRTELFGVFAQYGFIRSCWLRMGDKGPNRTPTPAYAFVTFSDPADAHKALQAPIHEKTLRGRHLRISPADSWHQPAEEADGKINWKPNSRQNDGGSTIRWNNSQQNGNNTAESSETVEIDVIENPNNIANSKDDIQEDDNDQPYNILDILNSDCLSHILSYIPIRDLIRSERVSKRWQNMVQEYIQSIRMFKTSWWQHVPVTLTTAVLRRVLQRLGGSLLRLHIDHHWSALNDRTAHTVGKFCPHLEELKLTDSSLVHLMKNDSCIESLTVANNTHVTGLFLTGSNPAKLSSLAFYNCYSLQGTVLSAAMESLSNLSTLKLDVCPVTMWKIIPLILSKLPNLEELSLSEYTSMELSVSTMRNDAFRKSLAGLTELKTLNLSRNIYITDSVMQTVAQFCPKLESLNISSCNTRKNFPHPGVGDEGLSAVCSGCTALSRLDVSYLVELSDAGLSATTRLPRLTALTARGNPALSAAPFSAALAACHQLEEIDACGCDNVSEEVVEAAIAALALNPRTITLRLAATAAAHSDRSQMNPLGSHKRLTKTMLENLVSTIRLSKNYYTWSAKTFTSLIKDRTDFPMHPLLVVNVHEDRSNPHLRADFVDRFFDESSDGSLEDIYDQEDFDEFVLADDDFFMDDDDDDIEDYERLLEVHGPNILLL